MKKLSTLLAAASLAALTAGAAQAEKYSYTTFNAPSQVMTRNMGAHWADLIRERTNGEIDFEIFAGSSLVPTLSILQATGDGVAHAAQLSVPYYAADLPINYVSGELGFKNPDYFALAFAYADYIMNDEASHAEWRARNIVPMGTVATPNYFYVCKEVVKTMADLQGKKVRSPGGGWGRFTNDIGMVAVSIPYNELFTSLERGAVDCAAMSTSDLTSGANVIDLVAKGSVVKIPLSPGYNTTHDGFNQDTWQSFTDEQRRIILDATAESMAKAHVEYEQEVSAAEQVGRDRGMTFTDEMDAEMQAFYDQWNEKNLQIVVDEAKGRGMEDPQAVLDRMQTYIDKWNGLIGDIPRDDLETLTKVLKENLFDKVDEKTYGMN